MVFNGISMKKVNNKFRGNGSSSSTIYSLNYKFDSNSIAGKISGTALELIKKYNDFAKDAQGNGDYVNAEIFRQYAEHYRKIVTEINERKNQQRQSSSENMENQNENDSEASVSVSENENQSQEENKSVAEENSAPQKIENIQSEQSSEAEVSEVKSEEDESAKASKKVGRKSFKIIEISHAKADEAIAESASAKTEEVVAETANENTPKRVYRRRKVAASS